MPNNYRGDGDLEVLSLILDERNRIYLPERAWDALVKALKALNKLLMILKGVYWFKLTYKYNINYV